MLNFLAQYDSKLMSLIDSIIEDCKKYKEIQLIITAHDNKLKQYQFDSSIFSDAHFIDFLIEYAKRNSVITLNRDEYIRNVAKVNNLFTQINPNTKTIMEFCDYLYLEPNKIITNIDEKIVSLIKTMQPYFKAEWNRVKVEAAGKNHWTVRQNNQINDFLKQYGEAVFSEFNI